METAFFAKCQHQNLREFKCLNIGVFAVLSAQREEAKRDLKAHEGAEGRNRALPRERPHLQECPRPARRPPGG